LEYPGVIDVVVESFAIEWLRMHAAQTDWVRLLNYLETVARRTHENLPVALTLLIQRGTGHGDITQARLQAIPYFGVEFPFSGVRQVVDGEAGSDNIE
jgi:hypothetical protein